MSEEDANLFIQNEITPKTLYLVSIFSLWFRALYVRFVYLNDTDSPSETKGVDRRVYSGRISPKKKKKKKVFLRQNEYSICKSQF
jgi:hypothetical protein